MARYYFDVADAHPPMPCEGHDLATISDAKSFALHYAGAMLVDQEPQFWMADEWVLTVSDEHRLTLFTITIMTANAPAVGPFL